MEDLDPASPEKGKELMQLAKHALDIIPVACYVLDANSQFIYLNLKAEALLHIKNEDVLGESIWRVFPEWLNTPYFVAVNDCIRDRQVSTHEYLSPITDTWLSLTATPYQEGALVTLTDCSKLKATQSQLLEEQRRLKAAQRIGHLGYFERHLDSSDVYCSEELFRIHGLQPQPDPIPFEKLISLVHPEDQGHYRLQIKEALARKQAFEVTNRIIRKDGQVRLVMRRAEFLKDGHGNVNRVYGTVQDITRQATTDLFLNNNNEVCFEVDCAFRITYANCKALDTWRKTPPQVMGKWLWDVFPEHLGTPFHEALVEAFDDKTQVVKEARCPVSKKWFYIQASPVPNGLMVFHLDTTELVEAREKMEQLEAMQQQEIFKATITTQEEQRKRIAESLHNGIGQILYGVKMSLDQVNLNNIERDQTSFYQAKRATEQLLADAIKETRRISHELTPAILEDFGLQEAVNDICRQFGQRLSIKCSFRGLNGKLDKYVEISVYRMVQELVTNIIRHAQATEASVQVELTGGQIILSVWDNGIGLNEQQVKGKGIGWRSIDNKIKLLNGAIHIDNRQGTKITITFPYQETGKSKL